MKDQRMYAQLVWEGLGFEPHQSLWTIASRGPLQRETEGTYLLRALLCILNKGIKLMVIDQLSHLCHFS